MDDKYPEIVAYSDIVDYIEQDQTFDGVWKFKAILEHKRATHHNKEYRECPYNVLVEWETGRRHGKPSREKMAQEFTIKTQ